MFHLVLTAALANSPFVVPPPATTVQSSAGVETCGPGDTTCLDKNGVIGAPASGTTDPLGVMLRGKQCSASDTACTAANVVIAGGMGIIDIGIDAGDPDANCPGDNDTVTLSIADANGTLALSAVVLTEGTQWIAVASDVPTTATNLAAAITTACIVSGVTYCTAVATSTEAQITLTPAASTMTALTESTAACTTVATLSRGAVNFTGNMQPGILATAALGGSRYCLDADCTSYMMATANDSVVIVAGGVATFTITASSVTVGAGGIMLGNNLTFYAISGVTYLGNTASYDIAATGAPTGSMIFRGAMMLPRVNAAATTGIADVCDANNVNGMITYFEDTNDTAAGQLCVCHNTGDAAWAWVQIQDMTTACSLD